MRQPHVDAGGSETLAHEFGVAMAHQKARAVWHGVFCLGAWLTLRNRMGWLGVAGRSAIRLTALHIHVKRRPEVFVEALGGDRALTLLFLLGDGRPALF
eukprot:scaffold10273_cov122-Isochrysis_galbana.AAC.3